MEAMILSLRESPRAAAARRQRHAPRIRAAARIGHARVGVNRLESVRGHRERPRGDRRIAEVVHDQNALVARVADECQDIPTCCAI